MKTICCVALLLAGYAQAGELLPMSGQASRHVQQALDTHLLPVVTAADDSIKVEPVLESIDIDGRAGRILWGPLAGGSHVVLRVRIIDGDKITEETFSERRGAWKGTFRPGQDYAMLDSIAAKAASFVTGYQAQ